MEKVLIEGRPFLKGNIEIIETDFGNLAIGSKVVTIGTINKNGNITSSSRKDTWTPFIIFRGKILLFFNGENVEYLVFELPKSGVINRLTNKAPNESFYSIYAVVNTQEIIGQDSRNNTIKIFRAIFLLENGIVVSN